MVTPGDIFPLDKAGIISTVLEGILYGFSVFMYGGTLWVLFNRRTTKEVNRAMVVAATLLFIFPTMHMGVDIHRIIEGLVDNRDFEPGGPAMWFANPAQFTFVFKNAIYAFQTVTGDGVVIYRCYMVWQSVWVIIFPLIMLCSVITTITGAVWACSQADPTQPDIFAAQTGNWITAFYASTLSTNFLCTTLLAYRIWQINAHVRRRLPDASSLTPVLMIIIDAGVLYSAALLSALLCFVGHSNGQYVVLDMVMPVISIAFYMVIIHVGIAKVASEPSRGGEESYSMGPIEVHITHLTERRRDGPVHDPEEPIAKVDYDSMQV